MRQTLLMRLKCARRWRAAAIVAAAVAPASAAFATNLTWDVNAGVSGAQDGQSPPNWDTSTAAWWNGSSDVTWKNSGQNGTTPDVSVFGAGLFGPAMQSSPFAVTLGAPVKASGITFNGEFNESLSGMYNLVTAPANPLTLTPGATIAVAPNASNASGTSGTISGGGVAMASGTVNIVGTGNGGSLLLSGSNSSFAASTVALSGNARLQTDSTAGIGNAAVTVANGSQWFVGTSGTINNNISLIGTGWSQDSSVPGNQLGALRATSGDTFAGSLTMTNNATISANDGASTVTVSGAIGGVFGLTVQQGMFTLSHANNTYSGTTVANNTGGVGTVTAAAAGSIGTGALAVNGGILKLAGASETVSELSGSGSAVQVAASGSVGSNTVTVSSTANLLPGELFTAPGVAFGTFIQSVNVGSSTVTLSTALQGTLGHVSASASCGLIANGSDTAATLTFGSDNNTEAFSGTIADNATGTQGAGNLSIFKNGTGTQTLSGTNTFSGTTTVAAGTLNVTGSLSSSGTVNITGGTLGGNGDGILTGAMGNVSLSAGTIAPGTIPGAGGTLRMNSLATTGGTMMFDVGGPTTDSINVVNGVTFSGGTLALHLAGNVTNGQVLTLMSAGSNMPTTGLTMGATTQGRTTLTPFITGKNLDVAVSGGPATMTWVGANNTGAWDEQTTQNWNDATYSINPDIFYDVDAVTFDDTASNFSPVLSGTLSPGSVTFNNSSAHAYTLSGTGSIAGMTALVKNNNGTVALNTANTYSGGTTINGGVLQINSGTSLGASIGAVTINAGTLEVTAGHSTLRNFILGSSSSTIKLDANELVTIGGTIADGASAGTLNLVGSGVLSLTGTNTYSGGSNIASGAKLQLTQISGIGTVGSGNVNINSGGVFNFALGSGTDVFSNNVTGSGLLSVDQSKGAVVVLTGNNTGFTGSTVVFSGSRLELSGPNAAFGTPVFNNKITVNSGASLYWNTGQSYSGPMSLAGTGFSGDGGSFGALRTDVGTPTFSGTIVLTGAAEIYNDAVTTLNGFVEGNFALQSAGSGRLVLSGQSDYIGGTAIESGTLQLGSATGLPSTGTVTLGSATAIGAQLANASGVLDLNGFSPTVGGLAVSGTGTGNIIGNSSNTSNSTLTYAGGSSSFAGVIADRIPGVTSSQTTGLTVTSGSLSLTGSNTYSGPTNINGGTLTLGATGSLASTAVNVAAAGTLQINSGGASLASGTNLAEGGTLNLFGPASINSLSGAGSAFLFSTLTVANGGTFTGKLLSSGNVVLSGGTLTLSNANGYTGSTTVNGGTLALTSAGSLAGNIYNIGSAGTFTVASGASIPATSTLTVNGAVTLNSATPTIASLFGASTGVVTLNSSNLLVTGGGTYAGVIQNGAAAGSLSVGGGTLTLTGTNTYTGPTTISSGVLNFSSLSNLGAGTAINFGGGTLQYAAGNTTDISARTISLNPPGGGIDTNGNNVTFANAIGNGGSGGLTKAGAGTLTLNGVNTYTGATNVDAGQLVFGASYTAGAKLNVANGASAKLAGAGTLLQTQALQLNSSGTLDLTSNTLDVHYGAGTSPDASIRASLIQGDNGGAWTGAGLTSSTAAADPVHHAVGYADGANNVVAGLVSGDELVKYTFAGDANLDGKVDVSDLGILATNYGHLTGQKWDQGDFTYDNGVDVSDLGVLATNYGAGTGMSAAQAAVQLQADLKFVESEDPAFAAAVGVPEPASVAGIGVACAGLLLGRRRRARTARHG